MSTESPAEDSSMGPVNSGFDLVGEITKVILTSNLSFLYGTTQVVQAITTLLFTTYAAWLYKLAGKEFLDARPWALLVLPEVCWGAAVVLIFTNTIIYSYRGKPFVVGDLKSTLGAYEYMLQRRRQIVFLPTLLTFAGLGILLVLLFGYI
jgi:hypothetical protein